MLAFLLPSYFHFVRKNQRGWIYYCLAALSFIAIYFTLCRDALLFGALAFAVCSVFCCIKGVNKKFSLIATITLGAIAAVIITLAFCGVFPESMFAFILSTKFSDRGRFDIWKTPFTYFTKAPCSAAASPRILKNSIRRSFWASRTTRWYKSYRRAGWWASRCSFSTDCKPLNLCFINLTPNAFS